MCSLEKRGRVFVLTLTGDGEHRLGPDLIDSLRSALSSIAADASSSSGGAALVTAGDGRFFSNGFDLAWAQSAGPPSETRARLGSLVSRLAPLIGDLLALPMPTVAAITGHAAAAGFILALAHDHMFMRADRGVLYMSELDIGLPLPDYFLALMRAKIGDRRALRDVIMKSAKLTAAEAMKVGIVDQACDGGPAGTLEAAVAMADKLAARGWDGNVYASIRKGAFPEACKAVGLEEEGEQEKRQVFASKL